MIRLAHLRHLICILCFASIPAFTVAQTAGQETPESILRKPQAARPAPIEEPTFNLNFGGGTLTEYIELLRRQSGGKANVIVMPEAATFPIPPMGLSSVGAYSALYVLDGLSNDVLKRSLNVRQAPRSPHGGEPVFTIKAAGWRSPRGTPIEDSSSVWSLKPLTDNGRKVDDVLAAIETALSMFPDDASRPQIKLHQETALLIARGDPTQLEAIGEVILVLSPGSHPAPAPSEADKVKTSSGSGSDSIASQITALQREIGVLKTQMTNLQSQINARTQPN